MAEQLRPELVVDQVLHPRERDQFAALCTATSPSELEALVPRIDSYLEKVEAAAEESSVTDVDTGRRLADSLRLLVQSCADYDDDQRALVRGSIEYFILTGDDQNDLDDILGFDDDVRVLNAVVDLLDRNDLAVTFD